MTSQSDQMVAMGLTDEAKLLAHSEGPNDNGHEPRVVGFRKQWDLRLKGHHLKKKGNVSNGCLNQLRHQSKA